MAASANPCHPNQTIPIRSKVPSQTKFKGIPGAILLEISSLFFINLSMQVILRLLIEDLITLSDKSFVLMFVSLISFVCLREETISNKCIFFFVGGVSSHRPQYVFLPCDKR